jgi:hypothetical protein
MWGFSTSLTLVRPVHTVSAAAGGTLCVAVWSRGGRVWAASSTLYCFPECLCTPSSWRCTLYDVSSSLCALLYCQHGVTVLDAQQYYTM